MKFRVYSFAKPTGNGYCIPVIADNDEPLSERLLTPAAWVFGATKEEAYARAEAVAKALSA